MTKNVRTCPRFGGEGLAGDRLFEALPLEVRTQSIFSSFCSSLSPGIRPSDITCHHSVGKVESSLHLYCEVYTVTLELPNCHKLSH